MRWLPVVGFEGLYSVSDTGLVRSEDQVRRGRGGSEHLKRGKVLSQTGDGGSRDYLRVNLWRENKMRSFRVHRLVGEAFLGALPDGMVTCHCNGDPHDNRLENLRYDTAQENSHDIIRHEGHVQARLKNADVEDMRWLHSLGVSTARLADEFGVSLGVAWRCVTRRTYSQVA